MKSKNIRLYSIIVVILALLVNTACNAAKEKLENKREDSKITWLLSQVTFQEVYKKIAEQIKLKEGIAVDFQTLPDDQFHALVKTKLAASEVPDILEYNVPNQNKEIHARVNMLDLSNAPWVARLINPKLLKDPEDGRIYALPKESSAFFGACYYNKKVLGSLGIKDPEPASYQEFLDILDKIKNSGSGITPLYMSEKDSWCTQIFMTLGFGAASADNKNLWNELLTNKVKWTDMEEFKDILYRFSDLYKNGYVNEDHLSATYDMALEAVATGKAAMILNGEWAANNIVAKWPETELGAFIIPYKDRLLMGTGSYVSGLFIPKAGKNADAAGRFLNLWSQPEYQNQFFAASPGFPGFKDVDGGNVLPCVKNLVDKYIGTGRYYVQMNDPMESVSPLFSDLLKSYVDLSAGKKTPDEVLQNWQSKFEAYMKQNRQPGF